MTLTFNSGTQILTYDSKNKSKKCTDPVCSKVYDLDTFYCSCFGQDPYNIKTKADKILSGFLPHVPYSWIRSITNISMLFHILKEVQNAQKIHAQDKTSIQNYVTQSFLKSGKTTINSSRKDSKDYIIGGPKRRIPEYLNALLILNLIDTNYNLTALGEKLINTKNTLILFFCFYFLQIKNPYLTSKIYSKFNVRHFTHIFNLLKKEPAGLTIEELFFMMMAHEEADYTQVILNLFKNVTCREERVNAIKFHFLGNKNKEMGRQKAAIFNILVAGNILNYDENSGLYSLTLEARDSLSFILANEQFEVLAKNLYSLEHSKKTIDDLALLLDPFLLNHKPAINLSSSKSGGEHENHMLRLFTKAGVNFRSYDKSFKNIILPADVTGSLTGGTEHNPDHLCTIKATNVLVDSKSSNSIHNEIHKVIAYNKYAELAKTKAFIFLDGKIPTKTILKLQKFLNESPNDIKNVSIFTKNAVEQIAKQNISKQVFEKCFVSDCFLMVYTKEETNFSAIEKDLLNNLLKI